MDDWLTVDQVAARTKRHPVTVRRAAQSGGLHGHQGVAKGRWSFQPAAVDAWITQQSSLAACGCRHLRVQKRAG